MGKQLVQKKVKHIDVIIRLARNEPDRYRDKDFSGKFSDGKQF